MKRLVMTGIPFGEAKHILFAEFDENRRLCDLQVFPETESLVERIYVGKVERIADNIGAAFVRITPEQNAYLPLSEARSPLYTAKHSKKDGLCAGDELLVQVRKDALKTKLPILSGNLSVRGSCTVIETGRSGIGISKKIPAEKAKPLKELAEEMVPENISAEIILRTNAAEVSREELIEDLKRQCLLYHGFETAVHKAPYSQIYRPLPAYIQKLQGMSFLTIDEIVTDLPEVRDELLAYGKGKFPAEKIRFYQDPRMPLEALYGLGRTLEKLMARQVWLKSGANIIIEQLETLTFIDVNTAKSVHTEKGGQLKVNLEAAEEIARQIRLRNLSGMILIDFINGKPEEEEQLIQFLKKCIAEDPVKTQFMDMTKLGLVELTRKKVHKSLREIL